MIWANGWCHTKDVKKMHWDFYVKYYNMQNNYFDSSKKQSNVYNTCISSLNTIPVGMGSKPINIVL